MQTLAKPIRLYWHPLSGHSHRVELMLSILGLPFEKVVVNLPEREQKTAAFLDKNPFGQVPVIEDGDVTLADSNAILVYLAKRYDKEQRWLPDDARQAAEVQRWLSVAAGPLAQGPALARVTVLFRKPPDAAALERAGQLLEILERQLGQQDFLIGREPTLADVALYTYTAHAPEGGISLQPFGKVRAWLSRIEQLPGFVAMKKTPFPEGG
jgi:glutathione S-transferase